MLIRLLINRLPRTSCRQMSRLERLEVRIKGWSPARAAIPVDRCAAQHGTRRTASRQLTPDRYAGLRDILAVPRAQRVDRWITIPAVVANGVLSVTVVFMLRMRHGCYHRHCHPHSPTL